MWRVVPRGGIGDLLRQSLDEAGLSDQGFARLLAAQHGGTVQGWRSQVYRMLNKGQVPQRETAMNMAATLGKDPLFFIPEPDPDIIDATLLSRLVTSLEQNPQEAKTWAPLLEELAAQLGEMAFRLRQVAAQQDANSSDG